jgi:two-component system chemotaxis response regulator CheY
MKILIVDDSPDIRKTLALLIRCCGHETALACDGQEGLNAFERGQGEISMIFTDNDMPNMNGLDLIKKIRETDSYVPVCLMSGLMEEGLEKKALDAGASATLSKPMELKDVREVLQIGEAIHS